MGIFMDQINKALPVSVIQEEEVKEIRLTWQGLADKLLQQGSLEIQTGQTLIIHQIDITDFLSLVEEPLAPEKVKLFTEIMKRFFLELSFDGSLALGPFQLADQSWNLTCGNSGSLRITAKPLTVRKSLQEVVSFLLKLPVGQALVLKSTQDLFLEEVSADAMFNYYQHCQDETDPVAREKGQDTMFASSSPLLVEKNLLLKIYGLNTKQVDRTIDAAAGGILFKPVGSSDKEPKIVIGLIPKP